MKFCFNTNCSTYNEHSCLWIHVEAQEGNTFLKQDGTMNTGLEMPWRNMGTWLTKFWKHSEKRCWNIHYTWVMIPLGMTARWFLSKHFNTVAALLVCLYRLSRSFLPISHSSNSFHACVNGVEVSPSPQNAILSVCIVTVEVVFQDFSPEFSHLK